MVIKSKIYYHIMSKQFEFKHSFSEPTQIIPNMLCVKKNTLKIDMRIVLDTRYVDYDSALPTRCDR